MQTSRRLICCLIGIVLNPLIGWTNDLGIVQVVTRPEPGKPSGHFTAAHLGRGLLLTCGHCCRYAGGPGTTVDVNILSTATRTPYRTEPAEVVCFDESADVGLIRLNRTASLPAAYALAPRDHQISAGMPVLQYTWTKPGGSVLRSVRSTVTAVDMFAGAANLETRHAPVQGDSGAPLVCERDGLIIGVTTGADLWGRFGVHAGTAAIYDLARRCDVVLPSSQTLETHDRVKPASAQLPK